MRISIITGSLAALTLTAASTAAFAQTQKQIPLSQYQALSVSSAFTHGPGFRRLYKTANGGFNSIDSLENGSASGMGAGPNGGVPNIN